MGGRLDKHYRLDPSVYSPRQKMVLLSRLVPVIECNTNMAEFGPRQTGKTYLYRNLSNYVRIISGGNVSPAVLFYNLRTRVPGELAVKDLVVFDEISKVKFSNPDEMMGKLKDYMESGMFERGDKKAQSDSSLVFMGNVTVEMGPEGYIPIEDLTYVLPQHMRDSAFIDRIHGLIPGWELPKISQSKYHLSKGYGIASDYFRRGPALHEEGEPRWPDLSTRRALREFQDKGREEREEGGEWATEVALPRRGF